MSNVVSLHQQQQSMNLQHAFPQHSELYFNAVERPLFWKNEQTGAMSPVPTHKCLLRKHPRHENEALQLAVVGKGYKIVQNKELFQSLEEQFTKAFTSNQLDGVRVNDKMSYNGRTCIREYQFPNVKCPIEGRRVSEIAFRTIVVNGFGGSSVKLFTGAIDFFCTNGMITGEFDAMYGRHTSGLRISNIVERVKRSIDVFFSQADMWQRWMHTDVTKDKVEEFLKSQFSDRKAQQLLRQFLIECNVHGETVWALYSAMTYYATHNEGEFTLRKTESDHEAATMLKREQEIQRCTDSAEFKQLIAA